MNTAKAGNQRCTTIYEFGGEVDLSSQLREISECKQGKGTVKNKMIKNGRGVFDKASAYVL